MNSILLAIALLGQFDMSGSSDLLMSGNARQVNDLSFETSQKRTLDLYSIPGCPYCPKAEKDVQELKDEFNVRVFKDPETFPEWVLKQGEKSGWGYPLVHWELRDGTGKVAVWTGIENFRKADIKSLEVVNPVEAAPTPGREVERVLSLLPKPEIAFVDYGCGDARWCIAAAERWGCRAIGVEIDSTRAKAARERVKSLGLDNLITIIEGDATKVQVEADVGVAYLYADVLEQLKPKLEKLRAFASYMHRPPGLPVVKNGDTWLYSKPVAVQQSKAAVWGGQYYSQPVCNSPNCGMCNSIRKQLNSAGMSNPPKDSIWWTLF